MNSYFFKIMYLCYYCLYILLTLSSLSNASSNNQPNGIILHKNGLELDGPEYIINEEYGTIKGSNLFHSFKKFHLNSNEGALFKSSESIQNIISRITGKDIPIDQRASFINGKILTENPVNIFFLNPFGIFIGPNANLNISGSIYFSTADYISSKNNEECFFASDHYSSVLFSESPAKFGFLKDNNSMISIDSAKIKNDNNVSVIGGNINISNTDIKVPEGRINIASILSEGYVNIMRSEFYVSNKAKMGILEIKNDSSLDVSGDASGNIFIRAGKFIIDNSKISAQTKSDKNGGIIDINVDSMEMISSNISSEILTFNKNIQHSKGGDVKIIVSKNLTLIDNSKIRTLTTSFDDDYESGSAGNIEIFAKNILLNENSQLITSSINNGQNAGFIKIAAQENFLLNNNSLISTKSYNNQAGIISIQGKNISFINGSGINTSSSGYGNGGDVIINSIENITFEGFCINKESSTIHTSSYKTGNAGNITLNAQNIFFKDGGGIITSTYANGKGGDININAKKIIDISGSNPYIIDGDKSSGIYSNSEGKLDNSGNAGDINIETDILNIHNLGLIKADTNNASGGNISIKINKLGYLSDSKISTTVNDGSGNGGNINIYSDIMVMNNSKILAGAYKGDGGKIDIFANYLIKSLNSEINAESEQGVDGLVEIESPYISSIKDFTVMPTEFLDARRWLKSSCSSRFNEKNSHIVVRNRDALPSPFDDWLISLPVSLSNISKDNNNLIKAHRYFNNGNFEHALILWNKELQNIDIDSDLYFETMLYMAYSYQSLGFLTKARKIFYELFDITKKTNNNNYKALYFSMLGDLSLAKGSPLIAQEYINEGMKNALLTNNSLIKASVLNNKAIALSINIEYSKAEKLFNDSIALSNNFNILKSNILINLIRLKAILGDYEFKIMLKDFNNALSYTNNLSDSYHKARNLISLGMFSISIIDQYPNDKKKKLLKNAISALIKARKIAHDIQNLKLLSCIYGNLGLINIRIENNNKAFLLLNKAVFYSQQNNNYEDHYYWKWQLGNLFKNKGNTTEAKNAYINSIDLLDPIRQEFFMGYRRKYKNLFHDKVRPVYISLIEVLIEEIQSNKNNNELFEKTLYKIITTLEQLKTAELQDYYEDECITKKLTEADNKTLVKLPSSESAIIYPILLTNQIALILSFSDKNVLITHDIDSNKFTKSINRLCMNFKIWSGYRKRLNYRFRYYAEHLYDCIIKPIEEELNFRKISNLIIVPDGIIRLIPFDVLFDGKKYLVEKYALGLIPALSLTEKKNIGIENEPILMGGLSKKADPPLPGVAKEIENIKNISKQATILLDDDFTLTNLTNEFKQNSYNNIHFATHGIVGNSPEETYISAFNEKITLNQLEKLININGLYNNNVDLLILSACKTAVGNERSALGLASITLKAGVKSTIATLWSIEDDVTSKMFKVFYEQLKNNKISKAKALQNTQKKFISLHPAYWAPFILIGNWL